MRTLYTYALDTRFGGVIATRLCGYLATHMHVEGQVGIFMKALLIPFRQYVLSDYGSLFGLRAMAQLVWAT